VREETLVYGGRFSRKFYFSDMALGLRNEDDKPGEYFKYAARALANLVTALKRRSLNGA
jgi:hypothetical protein